MSRHDFSEEEFAERRARARWRRSARRGSTGSIAIHPVSIHWLTGSDAKSYQEFQCLLVSAGDGPLVVLTRQGEVHEFETDSLADEVHGFGGGENEDPIAGFARSPALRAGRRACRPRGPGLLSASAPLPRLA